MNDTILDDFLQALPTGQGSAFDVFVSGGVQPTSITGRFQPANGDLLAVMPTGERPIHYGSASRTLMDRNLAVSVTDLPTDLDVPSAWLVLGPSSEQILLWREAVPEAQQLSAVCGIGEADLVIRYSASLFPGCAIRGRPVSCLVSARTAQPLGQPADVPLLFLDPREVGCPVCTRTFEHGHVTVLALCASLGFSVPPGYALHVWRDDEDAPTVLPATFIDGAALTVRLLPVYALPPRAVSSLQTGALSNGEAEGHSSSSESSDHACARSRSPRGALNATSIAGEAGGSANGAADSVESRELDGGQARPRSCEAVYPHSDVCSAAPLSLGLGLAGPVPTPCRNQGLPVLAGAADDLGLSLSQLRTTLETSTVQLDIVCAKTLLLWPVRASEAEDAGRQHIEGPEKVSCVTETPVLRLAGLVGPVSFDLTAQQMPLGRDLGAATEFLTPWPFELQHCFPSRLSLHASTVAALRAAFCPTVPPSTALLDEVNIFTDGSFNGLLSAWAVVIVGLESSRVRWLRWFSGRVCLDQTCTAWLGATSHSVQAAEMTAICFAQLWILSTCRTTNLMILSDSLVSVERSKGCWRAPTGDRLARSCPPLAQASEVLGLHPWRTVEHVRSHHGHAWNELADVLAKDAVSVDPGFVFHIRLNLWVSDNALESLWLLYAAWRQPQLWPALCGSHLATSGPATVSPCDAAPFFGIPQERPTAPPVVKWHCIRFVSANVQTLGTAAAEDGLHGFAGRVGYIREQLLAKGVHIAALQETRTDRAETLLSQAYIRLCSGRTATGHLGVELWLLRTPDADGVHFAVEEVTVAHYSPRLLCVRIQSPFLQALLAVVHAPVAQDPDRDGWWLTLHSILRNVAGGLPVFLIGDWNTRFDTPVDSRVGDLVFPSPYPVSPSTWSILSDFDLWLPSTFRSCHTGPSATWHAPGSGATARLDYVGIPLANVVLSGHSFVMSDVDLGQRSLDHLPVCADVWVSCCARPRRRASSCGFDRQAMATAQGPATICDICQRAPAVPWIIEASEHYHVLETFLGEELSKAFPVRRRRRQESYLSDATWILRDHRIWLQKRASLFRVRSTCADVWAALLAWRVRRSLRHTRVYTTALLVGGCRVALDSVRALRDTRLELRRALRSDKRQWVAELAKQAMTSPIRDIVAKLRPLLHSKGRVQRQRRGLPAVRLEDGRLATMGQEALDRWIRHFASNEGGVRCTPDTLMRDYRRDLLHTDGEPFELNVGDIPSRCDLEHVMVGMSCGKASGPDNVPTELVKFGAGVLSRVIYPLFLKLTLRLEEAVQFKGGVLHRAWKGKLPPAECSGHRALLVSSNIGKALHGALRSQCVPSMARTGSPLQVGGLPRYPVQFPAHVVRAFQSWQGAQSHAVLFLDLREAFYRVCRPMLHDCAPSDTELAAIFKSLGLPPAAFRDFCANVLNGSALGSADAPDWLRRTLSRVTQHTWFRLPEQSDVVRTSLGSRPGDNLADVLFFYLFADVLREVRSKVREAGLLASVPWSQDMLCNVSRLPAGVPTVPLPLDAVAWMDDLSLLLCFSRASEVLAGISSVSGILIDCCLRRGLMPNLDRGKTEVLASLAGTGSRGARAEFLSGIDPTVPCESSMWPEARLRVVPVYKHLGGLIHHKAGLRAEIRARAGQAWQAFRKHWASLFGQSHIPLKDKVPLFQSLVLTCLLYGVGTWSALSERILAPMARCYHNMCRSLLRRHFRGDTKRLVDDRVLALVGVPSLAAWIHWSRLGHLAALVRLRVPESWALLHAEENWLGEARASLEWLHRQLCAADPATCWADHWPAWRETIESRPGLWKGMLRRALRRSCRWETLLEGWQHCRGLMAKCLIDAGAFLPQASDMGQQGAFFCAPCQVRFHTRQQWSVHAFKTHGKVKSTRRLVACTQCPCCLKQYATNIALCNHLDRSVRCRLSLIRQGFSCSPEPGLGNRKADHGFDFVGCSKQGYGPAPHVHAAPASPSAVAPAASETTLRALQGCVVTVLEPASFPSLLEAYRVALCTECLTGACLHATILAWQDLLPTLDDDLSVRSAALHAAVAQWLSCCWSVDWLCGGDAVTGGPPPAIFRNSEMILSAIDFPEDLLCTSVDFCPDGGFLMGAERCLSLAGVGSAAWEHALCTKLCVQDSTWLQLVHGVATREGGGHCVFCLQDLPCITLAQAVATEADFTAAHAVYTLCQDVLLVLIQLWCADKPFAAVLPNWDASAVALLKRLPLIRWHAGRDLTLLHTFREASLPAWLSHF